jgi:hypothetical protein
LHRGLVGTRQALDDVRAGGQGGIDPSPGGEFDDRLTDLELRHVRFWSFGQLVWSEGRNR